MRILFVNHTFPGDLGPLLVAFAAQPGHEILFASCRGRRDFSVPGVRHVVLSPSRSRRLVGDGAGTSLDRAVEMGRQALQAFRLLRQSGFVPDMMLLSSALEQGLFLRDAFPDAFVACFAESLPSDGLAGDGKGLVRHLLQCRQMQQSDLVIRLAAEAENRDQEQRGVMSLPYPVDTDYFSPLTPNGASGPQAGTRILCAARDAADVWQMLRLAEVLLAQCPGCRLVLLCESAAGRESLAELGLSLPTGIEVPERLSLQAYRDLLRTAAVITAPAAACLSAPVLLEAMSCGVVPVLAAMRRTGPCCRRAGEASGAGRRIWSPHWRAYWRNRTSWRSCPLPPADRGAAFPAAGCHPRAAGLAASGTGRVAAKKAGRYDGLRRRRARLTAGRDSHFFARSPGRDTTTAETIITDHDRYKKTGARATGHRSFLHFQRQAIMRRACLLWAFF